MNSIQFISESERFLHTCCSKSMKSIQFISESGQLSVKVVSETFVEVCVCAKECGSKEISIDLDNLLMKISVD